MEDMRRLEAVQAPEKAERQAEAGSLADINVSMPHDKGYKKSLPVCGNKETVVEEILSWAGNGEDDIVSKYNIIRAFEDERAEGKAEGKVEGKAEDILDLLEELGQVPTGLRERICAQKDMETLRGWLKLAARVHTIEEFGQCICESKDSGMIENLNLEEENQVKK